MKNKKLLTGMLATVLSVCMICSNVSIAQAQETNDAVIANDETGIPDTNLYNAILEEAEYNDFSNKDGILTVSEAERVYVLHAESKGIKDLTGIEYCKNISMLYLDNNEISDISALINLTGSDSLDIRLSNNQLTNVDGLSNLKEVWKMDLSNNQIKDISGLSKLEYVGDWLKLENNQLTNVNGLSSLIYVECNLYLSNNQISDVSGFHPEFQVGGLHLANNQIKDVTPLASITGLWKLDLANNNIRDISALDVLKEKEEPCEIITDGNPIGEPEEPSEPETPNEPEVPSQPEKPIESEQPIYNADDFATLIGTQDVVVKPNDYVTITFAQGSKLNDTTGKTEYDFTTTVTAEFTNAKLPAFITENSFVTKVSYSYSGVLPASASIQIFVGEKYANTEVFYFLLNTDNTFDKNEVQKVKVNENGYITVTQEHCSDYVVTMENPADLYEKYEESQKPETDDNTNDSEDDTEDQNSANNDNNSEAPKTGDNAPMGMLSIIMMLAIVLVVLGIKGYKRA